ncbi:MAG: flippase-like domain-containing protein, partial [Bacteroidetes bacterium]|nr:flippase-like domain-containing protein [Bacteroidota bacterium]
MNKTLLNILKFLAFLSIGIGLMALAFKGIDLDEIIEGFKKANYWWVGLAIVFGAISHLVRALRWNLLIQPLGYKPNIILSFFAVMIGYLGNLGIPRLGEVLRPGVLTRYEKIPLNSLLGTILIERAIDMIFLIFLLMATLMWEFDRLNEFVLKTMVGWMTTKFTSSLDNVQMALLGLGVVVGLVLLFLLSRYLLKRSRYWEKARELVKGLVVGMKSIGKMEHNMGFVIYTFIMWF